MAQSSPGIPVRSPRRLTPIDSLPDERGDTSRSRESRPQSALEASAKISFRIPSVQSPPPLYFQAALPYHILAPHPNKVTNCDREQASKLANSSNESQRSLAEYFILQDLNNSEELKPGSHRRDRIREDDWRGEMRRRTEQTLKNMNTGRFLRESPHESKAANKSTRISTEAELGEFTFRWRKGIRPFLTGSRSQRLLCQIEL